MKYRSASRSLLYAVALLLLAGQVASAYTLRDAKAAFSDGAPVTLNGLSVTACFTGCVYVEQTDRAQAIRVNTSKTFAEGTLVNISGTMQTEPLTGERYIAAYETYPQEAGGTFSVKPLALLARTLASTDDLDNVGMLVTVWGPVTGFDNPDSPNIWFTIGEAFGPEVKVVVPGFTGIDKYLEYAFVTGVCSVEQVGGQTIRVVKARRQKDIVPRWAWVENRIKTMTLDQKVGQLFMVQFSGDTLTTTIQQTLQNYHLGGVIYLQVNGNLNDPVRSANFSNALQGCAIADSGVPLLISMDQEGGRVTRITGGADFPGNMALGASRDPNKTVWASGAIGEEVRAVGGNMDLAPVLDVNNNPLNPVIGVRSFGEQWDLVSQMGLAYLYGLHGAGAIATGKHFPGHGDTATDSHTGLPIVTYDLNTLNTVHAAPFRWAIEGGIDAIMTAHILVTCLDPNYPATLSPLVIDGYLRDELAFNGVCMTDSLGMGALTSFGDAGQIAVRVVQSGVDILLNPTDLNLAFNSVRSAVQSGTIPTSRLDQSVARILTLKYRYGLFANPYVDANLADDIVGSTEHRNLEYTAAAGGITLVQNSSGFLPLNLTSGQKILLVTVQGTETTTDAASRFATIMTAKHSNLQSLALAVNPTSSQRTTVKNAAASAAVVVIGTSRAQLSTNAGQATLVNELLAMGKPVVVVGLREPYELASFPGVNAYVAAYNYRNCGFQAAADVIFGDLNPFGLLPVTVPGCYSYGWGLSYH